MIPQRLEVEGFLAYRNRVLLDFSALQYAVIVGENGAGKSSLLDAILYALYGKARDAEKMDDLINDKSEIASVTYEFKVGDDVYKVVRERERNGDSRIYFYKYDPNFRMFKPTGHRGVRSNEEAVIKVVGLNYEAFTSSALLIQGKSDKFLSARPSERKNVLSEILGLNIYENIRAKATEHLKQIKNELSPINNELSGLQDIDDEFIKKMQVSLEGKNNDLKDTRESLEQIKQNLKHLEDKERVESELKENTLKLESCNLILNSREEIIRDYNLYQDSVKIYPHLLIVNNLKEDVKKLEANLAGEIISQELFVKNIVPCQQKLVALEADFQKQDVELKIMRDNYSQIDGTIKKLNQDELKLKQRLSSLKGKDICPLCGTELTTESKGHLQSELSEINLDLSRLSMERDGLVKKLTIKENNFKTVFAEFNEVKKEYTSYELKIQALEKSIKNIKSDIEEKNTSINKEQEFLVVEKSKGNRAIDLTLAEIESKIRQKEITNLYQEVLVAEKQKQDLQVRIEKLTVFHQELIQLVILLDNHSFEAKVLKSWLTDKQNQLNNLEKEKEILVRKLAVSEESLKNKMKLTARKKELDQKENIYSFISKAFSSENIQTMVVKKALYDIEHHSSDLLKKLSNDRLSLDFKATGSLDKLDISVKDSYSQKIRKYELLSGGEKFRTDVSIALGIGRYVSSISNRVIECIFIDEGFGSLDRVGRESLIEVVRSLKNEIKMILIITHLEDIAEAFPVKIKVKKEINNEVSVSLVV
ncbi:MAG: Nuclease SbcCD subunit C [candidate division WS2 bacterium]|uniref:Nuclease SbcCD subunit C n=1 Tax=Psychracetigena formicireducens TaxID=2986056 RepID=A0A9E2BEY1_PSYF1|nr:Nuclease SbcCD subunit C [Candidatus Psychracetigena formicireducens]MBT9144361.1 Nuclease SbcCD subunit C [Candidatus Psychracetigena formicireducens]